MNFLLKIIPFYFNKQRINLQIHYSLLTTGGFLLGVIRENISLLEINFLKLILSVITILIAFYSSLVFNDIEDFEGDRINFKITPLTAEIVDKKTYFKYGILFLFLSLFLSLFLNIYFFLNILILHIIQIIYTFPPFRLKRFYPISIFLLSLAALFSILSGFSVIESSEFLKKFPLKLYLIFILAFPFAMNFRDVLDLKGDKIQGIKTLAVIVGEKRAPIFAGISLFITYILVALILFKIIFFLLSVIAGTLCIIFSLRKKFDETPFFTIYFSYLIIFIFVIYFKPNYIF